MFFRQVDNHISSSVGLTTTLTPSNRQIDGDESRFISLTMILNFSVRLVTKEAASSG